VPAYEQHDRGRVERGIRRGEDELVVEVGGVLDDADDVPFPPAEGDRVADVQPEVDGDGSDPTASPASARRTGRWATGSGGRPCSPNREASASRA
jgi:hypothetical protein